MSKVPDFQDLSLIPHKFFKEIKNLERDEEILMSYCELVLPKHIDIKHEFNGYTMLMYAVSKNYLGMVKTLLDKNADINAVDRYGNSVIMRALFDNKELDSSQYLLENYSDVIKFGQINCMSNDVVLLTCYAEGDHNKLNKIKMLAECPYTNFSFDNDSNKNETPFLNLVINYPGPDIDFIFSRNDININYAKRDTNICALEYLISNQDDKPFWKETAKKIINHPEFDINSISDNSKLILKNNQILKKYNQ